MIEKATGVILRTQSYSETSLILRWLTPTLGRISTIAKGARRPKSSFSGKLDLFVEADLTFTRSRRSDLHTLREVSVKDFHLPLRDDIDRLQLASYAVTLIEQTTETDTPLPEVFELFGELLRHLTSVEARPRLVFALELKLLRILGLAPAPEQTSLPPDTQELLVDLTRMDWAEIGSLSPPAKQVKRLARFLHGFLIHHLGKVPKLRADVLKHSSK